MSSDPCIDAAYNVRLTVEETEFRRTVTAYRTESERVTGPLAGHRAIAYDEHSDERLDVWGVSDEGPRPVFLAVHGGYWRMLSRHDTAFMAGALNDAGIATVSIDYTLAPTASLEEIVRQVRAAVAWIHRHGADFGLDPDRIVVGGSSAGGHLTATTMVGGWQEPLGLPPDVVKGALPISGLFDLRPLVKSFANEWLGLDAQRAAALSPLLADFPATTHPRAVIAVAEHDGTGFLEQSSRFHDSYSAHAPASLLVVPGRHHYDIFLDLADPDSALFERLVHLVDQSSTAAGAARTVRRRV
ncbi:alpha/beta hydrolase [Streptomyces sp. NBC_00690]|uniref:alpha/beta hydrolase n=1 Tax=Streptomyces sp. NBC_00690 TaxID=2975808 RepID=UPI002E299D77|nr:alpha/beta hydrolase [Streptomyces sp. NBC_00690]